MPSSLEIPAQAGEGARPAPAVLSAVGAALGECLPLLLPYFVPWKKLALEQFGRRRGSHDEARGVLVFEPQVPKGQAATELLLGHWHQQLARACAPLLTAIGADLGWSLGPPAEGEALLFFLQGKKVLAVRPAQPAVLVSDGAKAEVPVRGPQKERVLALVDRRQCECLVCVELRLGARPDLLLAPERYTAGKDLAAALASPGQTRVLVLDRHLPALPPELGQLTALRHLELSLEGPRVLPPELGNLTALEALLVDRVAPPALPPELAGLRRLRRLRLVASHFTTWPAVLEQLPSLQDLELRGFPPIALPLPFKLPGLRRLTLAGGAATESLPWPGFANLGALESLVVSGSGLTRSPLEGLALSSLRSLSVTTSRLNHVGSTLASHPQLRHLDLTGNKLTAMPDELAGLGELRSLSLDYNPVSQVPGWIGQLRSLETLQLDQTGVAELPASVGQLSRLRMLALGGPALLAIPEVVAKLESLELLRLGWGSQVARLPDWLAQLPRLKAVLVDPKQLAKGEAARLHKLAPHLFITNPSMFLRLCPRA